MPAATHPVHLVLGLIIWAVWFVVLYGGLSVGCALAPPDVALGSLSWLNAVLLILTLACAAVLLWLAACCWRGRASAGGDLPRQFIVHVGAAIYLLSAAAVLLVGLPVFALPPCI